ncbi:hypothetical protein L3X38_007736 [Prunus dulcis]|uniref:Uncharacterized protein n=1 Tax=Prunus dulcis TaxID=3755 RepID=A0AAD5F673_PRUDU|nr:hypothetical protein L3X38_007736 [Prunus dulcis]
MTEASSFSNPSQLSPPAAPSSSENGEEAAGVVRTSPLSISLLRPPISTSEIVRDPTARSGPNLQDDPIPCRTYRNFRIGIWRSWAPWARLTRVRVV